MNARNWHTADILAGLKKRGTSLALSRSAGLSLSTQVNT
jgi:Ner family transcriptional regulator